MPPSIHPTAIISPLAHLADSVSVGPYSIIEAGAKIAENVRIDAHVSIRANTHIGAGTSIGWGSILGADPQDLSFDPLTESNLIIGEKNQIREYVTIHRGSKPHTSTSIGHENFLMTGVHLAHDVTLGNKNVLANNVLLAGHIHVGNQAFLGGGSGFHQFIHIGNLAIVQGNAAISQDIPPYCMAHGQNQLSGLNVIGLRRNNFSPEIRSEIKSLYKLLLAGQLNRSEALTLAAQQSYSPQAQILLDAVKNCSKKGVISR